MSTCATHPDRRASYLCDGCRSLLCDECIEESHALLLCGLCGERALPTGREAPATVKERKLAHKRASMSTYTLEDAFAYPFRGQGLYVFIAALLSAAFVAVLQFFGQYFFVGGCVAAIIWLGWLSLLVGIQFKIIDTTAKWDDELPDWPNYYSLGERVVELLTFVVIAGFQWGPFVAFLYFGADELLTTDPSLPFWLGAAACLWLGTALGIFAWGAAAIHWRHLALRLDLHLRGLLSTGADSLQIANLTFAGFGGALVLKGLLGDVPIVGAALAGTLGIYWSFLAAHLAGILFRRHATLLHDLYEG